MRRCNKHDDVKLSRLYLPQTSDGNSGVTGAGRCAPGDTIRGGDTLMKVLNIFGDKFIKKEILDKRSPGVSGDSGL